MSSFVQADPVPFRFFALEDCLPLVVQVYRFDRWKDPRGVIEAFRIARRQADATLVLVGTVATDDPEGQPVFAELCVCRDERTIILAVEDLALASALQRSAAVVLPMSLREDFGLAVTEAMWKGAAAVSGNVGGIRRQIRDGETGFPVNTMEEAADCIAPLIRDPDLRRRLGPAARETVRGNVLMTRLVEDRLDLLGSLEAAFTLGPRPF